MVHTKSGETQAGTGWSSAAAAAAAELNTVGDATVSNASAARERLTAVQADKTVFFNDASGDFDVRARDSGISETALRNVTIRPAVPEGHKNIPLWKKGDLHIAYCRQ